MSTSGPLTTVGTSGVTFDFPPQGDGGSTGFDGDLCASATLLFEAPEEARLLVVDQDGDGVDELWLSFFEGGGPGSSAALFTFSPEGFPEPGGFFPGFIIGMHDIDGDGIKDGTGLAFGGGGPPELSFLLGLPAFIEGSPAPIDLGLEDGFEAFADVSGDGRADFIRNIDGALELLEGDGLGAFEPIAATPSALQGAISWMQVRPSSTAIAAESAFFDGLDDCIEHQFSVLVADQETFLGLRNGLLGEDFVFSAPLWADEIEDGTLVLGRACDLDDASRVTVQAQRFNVDGTGTLEDFPASTFAATGDVDGDGLEDILLGRDTSDGVVVHFGVGNGNFLPATGFDVDFANTVPSRAYTVDIDHDGREEIILGTRDGGTEIVYQRIDLDPC